MAEKAKQHSTSQKQYEAVKKPCPKCSSKLIIVGDLSDFQYDFVICTGCMYTMDFWGREYDV